MTNIGFDPLCSLSALGSESIDEFRILGGVADEHACMSDRHRSTLRIDRIIAGRTTFCPGQLPAIKLRICFIKPMVRVSPGKFTSYQVNAA